MKSRWFTRNASDWGWMWHPIQRFAASSEASAAYGIDFGLLDTGETALVEANDGYALGAYSIDAVSYARLLFTRGHQLTHS